MKKLIIFFTFFIFVATTASAMVILDNTTLKAGPRIKINAIGYYDFPPIGFLEGKEYKTVISPLIEAIENINAFNTDYTAYPDHSKNIEAMNKADFFIGCYPKTYDYRNMYIVYPAIFTMPISIMTLPDKKISKISDLKTLKAGFSNNEPFPDFIKDNIKDYKAKEFNNYTEMFKALFAGEIDFIFSNYYYGLVQIAEHGLGNEISFSKKGIWDSPLFICLNKESHRSRRLLNAFNMFLEDEEIKEKIKQNLIDTINEIKIKNRGVSAPAFIERDKDNGKTNSSSH
ncbi:MAG: transporter substrate-binding domain-containing protein [Alphaproteobacteria bacterium]